MNRFHLSALMKQSPKAIDKFIARYIAAGRRVVFVNLTGSQEIMHFGEWSANFNRELVQAPLRAPNQKLLMRSIFYFNHAGSPREFFDKAPKWLARIADVLVILDEETRVLFISEVYKSSKKDFWEIGNLYEGRMDYKLSKTGFKSRLIN